MNNKIKRLFNLLKLNVLEGYDNTSEMRNLYRELITMGYPKSLLDLKLKLHREQYQSELSLIKDLLEVEVLPYRMIQEHKDFIRVKNYFEGVE